MPVSTLTRNVSGQQKRVIFTTAFPQTHNIYFTFKVCKSVRHRTIQINHQPDAKNFQFIILTFIYSSTCFGRFPAHHQELNDCSGSLWFYLRIVVTVVLCSWSGRQIVASGWWFIWITRSDILAVAPIAIISVIWDVTLCCTDTLQHSAKYRYISIKLHTITFPKTITL